MTAGYYRRMPESPYEANRQKGRDKALAFEEFHEEASPGDFFAESQQSVDGDAGKHPADNGNQHETPDVCQTGRHVVRAQLRAGHKKRDAQGHGNENRHKQPTDKPPTVDSEGNAQATQHRFFEDQLCDYDSQQGKEHAN